MKIETIRYHLTFIEPLLGSASGNKELHEEFIASKAPTATDAKEELDAHAVAEEIEKASTIFPRDEQGVFLWDYQVRGFFKESIAALIELGECSLSKWQCKRTVDSYLFAHPRRIRLFDTSGNVINGRLETLQRPLRAETMQGERVALARSEMLPAGTQCEFELKLLCTSNGKSKAAKHITRELVTACLDYGALKGFGQWRSGGYGRFIWKELA